ncbi:MAG: type II secretion system F family protein [Pseudomonadales bacterium]
MAIELEDLNGPLVQTGAVQKTAIGEGLLASFSRGKFTTKDRMFFTEQLSLLLETGNSLIESLRSVAAHSQNPRLRGVIEQMIVEITEGNSFSAALQKHGDLFPTTYINLIKASENGGFTAAVLAELLEMDEKKERLDATLKSALSYPAFLMLFSFAVVIFVLIVVFPKFAEMFANIADELPLSTTVLMWLSDKMLDFWPFIIGGTAGLLFLAHRWLNSSGGIQIIDTIKLRVPFVRQIFTELYVVQSMRVMGLSLGNGVSVMDTLASCRDVVRNHHYQQFMHFLEMSVQEGKGLGYGFKQTELVPDIVRQMVITGEESGSLPKVMDRIASYYERQLEKRLTMLAKAAEPAMLLIMGVVVGLLVSSLILPIFKLSRAVT